MKTKKSERQNKTSWKQNKPEKIEQHELAQQMGENVDYKNIQTSYS